VTEDKVCAVKREAAHEQRRLEELESRAADAARHAERYQQEASRLQVSLSYAGVRY
jgi:hypothetical protein